MVSPQQAYPFSHGGVRREVVLVHDDHDGREPVLPHRRLQVPQAEPTALEQVLLLEIKYTYCKNISEMNL